MGTKQNAGQFDCMDKVAPDEPFFVLRAKDPIGAHVVRYWVDNAHAAGHEAEKIMEASICADDMDTWRAMKQSQDEAIADQEKLFALEASLKLFSGKVLFSDGEFRFISDKKPVVARSLRGLIEKMPKDDIPFR